MSVLITLAEEFLGYLPQNGQQENQHEMTLGMTGAPARRRVVKSVQFDAIDRAAEIGGILRAGLAQDKNATRKHTRPARRKMDDLVLSKLGNLDENHP